jgi:Deoxycytidylate deaminase
METPARALKSVGSSPDLLSKSSTTTTASVLSDELLIALCGPVGSPIHKVASLFAAILTDRYGYEVKPSIRLSQLIQEHTESVPDKPMFERINRLIELGNNLRQQYGASVLADLAISKIALDREQAKEKSGVQRYEPKRRVCYIIDSIKNQEEYDALRQVYRDMLYFVGVYSPVPVREKNLLEMGMSLPEVYTLIDRDSGEEIAHGQSVRTTFPLADFFLRVDSAVDKPLTQKIERFLALIFNSEVITPSAAETAMYAAASAAGNSACLSRQVGAALTDAAGAILALGWNDVPKAGGGLYEFTPDDPIGEKDKRCMNLDGGKCFNDFEKHAIIEQIVDELRSKDIITAANKSKAVDAIKTSKIKDLIEFSRSVHAEMQAIIQR